MGAIYRREMRSYFTTPVGYIFLAVFFFFSGFYFSRCCLYENTSDLTEVFSSMFTICVFLIPLLTMRLLSEERKNKTDQLALTAPVSLLGLALGKFLAALSIFATGLSVALLYGLFFAYLGVANWSVIIGYMVGLLLLGASLTAIGMYICFQCFATWAERNGMCGAPYRKMVFTSVMWERLLQMSFLCGRCLCINAEIPSQ